MRERMVEELYKLDHEDLIGDITNRFKFLTVDKNSYGLSTREILFVKDMALKQFISLKNMAPITVPKKGKEEKKGGGIEGESNS